MYWFRASVPNIEGGEGETWFWLPGTMEDDPPISYRRCLETSVLAICPCGAFIGKVRPYRRGVSLLVGCKECGIRYKPEYFRGEMSWYTVKGEYVGNTSAPPLMEIPE